MTSQHDKSKRWRPWQFSLREFMLLFLICACVVAWWLERQKVLQLQTVEARRAHNAQRQAFELGLEVLAKARNTTDVPHRQSLVALAEQLFLVADGPPEYIPHTGRPRRWWTDELRDEIAYARRDIARDVALADALQEIAAAIQEGDRESAIATKRNLLDMYPGLAENAALARATQGGSDRAPLSFFEKGSHRQ